MNANDFHADTASKTKRPAPMLEEGHITPAIEAHSTEAPVSETPTPTPSGAGTIILQWLTYAFWGWLIIGLIWLMALVLDNALTKNSDPSTGLLPYAIAGTVVVFPIALICELFYRKREPKKKSGASMVITVIHAVLFALLGIAALITAVFTLVNLSLSVESDISAKVIVALTAGFAAVLYGITFVRTLQPFKKSISLVYGVTASIITVVLLAFAIAGPLATSIASRGDRSIEQNLPRVTSAISSYVRTNGELPKTLSQVTITNADARALVADDEVEYIAEGQLQAVNEKRANSKTFRYQLCATYDRANASGYSYDELDAGEYTLYIQTTPHEAGRVCYKLQTTTGSSSFDYQVRDDE